VSTFLGIGRARGREKEEKEEELEEVEEREEGREEERAEERAEVSVGEGVERCGAALWEGEEGGSGGVTVEGGLVGSRTG
jgi:hypothetical protein